MSEVKVATVGELIKRSKVAQEQFAHATQEQADAAAKAMCKVIYDNQVMLGTMAAEETRMGDLDHKIAKCRNKSSLIWHTLKGKKSVGVISDDKVNCIKEIAKPMGVVASVIPSTNPVVTPMSNSAFALKTRNSIIFAPHPRAVELTKVVVDLQRAELKKLGLPEDLVLGLESVSIEGTNELMSGADVIIATGGMAMVKSAYSSGKPAYGVGAGNVQVIVDTDADLNDAAAKIITGRSFDNGLICLGEQTVFVQSQQYDALVEAMEANGAHYVSDEKEVDAIREGIFPESGPMSRDIVGKNAVEAAEIFGIKVSDDTKVILVKGTNPGHEDVLCREKMVPVLTIIPYNTFEEGVAMMNVNLDHEGKGHSVGVHTNTPAHAEYVGEQCCVSRCIVNQPCGTTGGGSPTNGFGATTTLGCGTWGNNSFSGNLGYEHLMNITRVGYPFEKSYMPNPEMAWED